MLNFELMKNPMNWVILTLMILIAAIAFNVVMHWETSPTA
jgi:hypothetical protein